MDDRRDEGAGHEAGIGGSATSPLNPITGSVEPLDGPLDRVGAEADDDAGMTNDPLPLPNDEPEVGLATPIRE